MVFYCISYYSFESEKLVESVFIHRKIFIIGKGKLNSVCCANNDFDANTGAYWKTVKKR